MSLIKAFFIVSRYEYIPVGTFIAFAIAALASGSWIRLQENMFLIILGILLGYLSHMLGSQINCLADYDLDKDRKLRLAMSVNRLGHRRIWCFIWAESILALFICLYMVWLTGKPILTVLWIIGWGVAMGYSIEPLRFKRRGFLNPFSLTLVIYVLPLMYGYLAVNNKIGFVMIILIIAIGFQMFSLFLMNEVEDIPEDRSHKIETPCVRYGIWPIVPIAMSFFFIAVIPIILCFYQLIESKNIRATFLVMGILGQLIIIYDLISFTMISWRCKRLTSLSEVYLQDIRHIGKRNILHFGILGLTISIGSILSLY